MTSPEVGPLFGACVARCARRRGGATLGAPDPFVVVEAGAGRGPARRRRARGRAGVRAARCATCSSSARRRCGHEQRDLLALEPFEDALGPVARRRRRRRRHRGRRHGPDRRRARRAARGRRSPAWCSPTSCSTTCRSRVVERAGDGWLGGAGRRSTTTRFVEVLVPAATDRSRPRPTWSPPAAPTAARVPGARRPRPSWLRAARGARAAAWPCSSSTTSTTAAELAARGAAGVAAHLPRPRARRRRPSSHPGRRTSPCDVAVEYLRARGRASRSARLEHERHAGASGCATLGIDELVADGARAVADARAHVGDLEALRRPQPGHRGGGAHRSRRPRRPPRPRLPRPARAARDAAA